MQRWEYATVRTSATMSVLGLGGGDVNIDSLRDTLNRAGSEGWEVCGVIETNTSQGRTGEVVVLLKRPLVREREGAEG